MDTASFFQKGKNAILKKLSGDMSGIFIGTTIIGYIAGAAGQLYGINKNDKLDSSKKNFLKFQEIADCVINIAAYFTITKACTNLTKKLASSGKILSKSITEGCKTCGFDKNVKNIGKEISTKLSKLSNAKEVIEKQNYSESPELLKSVKTQINNLTELKDKYSPFENGMAMLGTIGGGLVSADIISPVLRNKYASQKQQQKPATNTYYYSQTLITNSNPMKV